ncbi:hypothetical protein [Streptomyces sp. NPDC054797]
MSTMRNLPAEMAPETGEPVLSHCRLVDIPAGTRIFEGRRRADRFWMVPAYTWRLGATAIHHSNMPLAYAY